MEGYLEFKESSKVNNGSCCRDVYNFTVLLLSRKLLSRVILFARPRLEKNPSDQLLYEYLDNNEVHFSSKAFLTMDILRAIDQLVHQYCDAFSIRRKNMLFY